MLRELREQRHLSQRELAAKAKTTGAYIAMLETGVKQNPSKAVLRRLAKALGVTMAALEYDAVLIMKFSCEKCLVETVVYGYDRPGQQVTETMRAEILKSARQLHDQDCAGEPTSKPHPATKRPL